MKRSASEPGLSVVGGQDNFRRALMIFGAKACLFVKSRSEMKIYFPKTSCALNFSFLKVMSPFTVISPLFNSVVFPSTTTRSSNLYCRHHLHHHHTTFPDCQPHHYLPSLPFCCFTEHLNRLDPKLLHH